jgi:hypothetical protein
MGANRRRPARVPPIDRSFTFSSAKEMSFKAEPVFFRLQDGMKKLTLCLR